MENFNLFFKKGNPLNVSLHSSFPQQRQKDTGSTRRGQSVWAGTETGGSQ
jgi:hypothetical protein